MKASELRIGNLVSVYFSGYNIPIPLTGIRDRWVYFDEEGEEKFRHKKELEYVQPIPLTEEWLVKFGSIMGNSENDSYPMFYNIKDNHLYDDANFALCNKISWNKIKYVHQLQNLVHALTGEELTLQ